MARAKQVNFDSMLSSASSVSASSSNGKKKSKYPQISLPEELVAEFEKFQKAKKDEKNAIAEKNRHGQPIMDHMAAIADENGFTGCPSGTYEILNGSDVLGKYIIQDKWSISQIPEDHEEMKQELGDEVYDELIDVDRKFILKPEVFQDEALQKRLAAALGADFGKFFIAEVTYKAKPGLKERVYSIAKNSETLQKIRAWMSQYKPSIR